MIGERLKRARKAAGLSLRDLGFKVNLSHTAISKFENDQLAPSSSQLLSLSKILGVRSEYFLRPFEVEIEGIEYRKRSTTPQSIINRISADIHDQAERWEELLNLFPKKPIPDFKLPSSLPNKVKSLEEIESISELMRHKWELGLNPIPDLVDSLESKGILVIFSSVDDKNKFDGLAGTIGKKPLIVLSVHWPGDRQRFTLAHELGHLVLAGRLSNDLNEEKACNHFAGAFLLPRPTLLEVFGEHRNDIDLQELHILKHEFGISMQGIVQRIFQCGVINESLKRTIFKVFSKKGWRKSEPGEIYPSEETWLFPLLVYRAISENYIGESKAAELLKKTIREFRRESRLEEAHAGFNQ